MPTYNVKWRKFNSEERFPVLQDSETGMPLPFPTLFAVNELRTRGDASKTIEACLRAILHLLVWAESMDIDIDARCREGMLFHGREIDSLIGACQKPLKILRRSNISLIPGRTQVAKKVFSLPRKSSASYCNVSRVRLAFVFSTSTNIWRGGHTVL
jgi:hypothetical protein